MTKYTATCSECGQRWHCWAERGALPVPGVYRPFLRLVQP